MTFVVDKLSNIEPDKAITIIAEALIDSPSIRERFVNMLSEVEDIAADVEDASSVDYSWDDLILQTCFALIARLKC